MTKKRGGEFRSSDRTAWKGKPCYIGRFRSTVVEIWLLEKISSRSVPPFKLAGVFLTKFFNLIKLQRNILLFIFNIFFFLVEKYFCCHFHNRLFLFFSFLFGNDLINMDETIPFSGSNSSVFFFNFLYRNFGEFFFWISKISQIYTRKKIPYFSKFLAQKISKLQHGKKKKTLADSAK